VGRRLRLRHAPRLEFVVDDTADKAAHLTGLINRAVASDRAAAAANETTSAPDDGAAESDKH
jgi:hypothetical protein